MILKFILWIFFIYFLNKMYVYVWTFFMNSESESLKVTKTVLLHTLNRYLRPYPQRAVNYGGREIHYSEVGGRKLQTDFLKDLFSSWLLK